MSLLRRCRVRSLALAALSLAALSLAERSTPMLAGGLLLCAASWYALEGPRGRPLPKWVAGTLSAAVVVGAVIVGVDTRGLADLIAITGRALGAVLVIMLFSRRGTVDERSVIALSAGVLVASCMLSTALLVGAAVAAATVAAVMSVTAYRLAAGSERAADARKMPSHALSPAPPPELPLRSTVSLGTVTAVSSALVLGVALVVFLVFPRLWRDPPGLFRRAGPGTTGFAPEIRLRTGDRISTSRREVFVVRWLDSAGQAVRFARTPYLRGAVLDSYQPFDARWRASSSNPVQITFRAEPGRFSNLGNPPIDTRVDTWTQVVEMRSLALLTSNETNASQKAVYKESFDQFVSSIKSVLTNTKFADAAVFSGTTAQSKSVQTGINASDTQSLSFSGLAVTGGSLAAAAAINISTTDSTNIGTALTALDTAIETVSKEVAKVGGYQNSMQFASDYVDSTILNKSIQLSQVMDADFAQEATNLAAARIRQDASTAVLAQANSMSRTVADFLLKGAMG